MQNPQEGFGHIKTIVFGRERRLGLGIRGLLEKAEGRVWKVDLI